MVSSLQEISEIYNFRNGNLQFARSSQPDGTMKLKPPHVAPATATPAPPPASQLVVVPGNEAIIG